MLHTLSDSTVCIHSYIQLSHIGLIFLIAHNSYKISTTNVSKVAFGFGVQKHNKGIKGMVIATHVSGVISSLIDPHCSMYSKGANENPVQFTFPTQFLGTKK